MATAQAVIHPCNFDRFMIVVLLIRRRSKKLPGCASRAHTPAWAAHPVPILLLSSNALLSKARRIPRGRPPLRRKLAGAQLAWHLSGLVYQ
jgi:hypothetical protein